jgi:hypothetical protein
LFFIIHYIIIRLIKSTITKQINLLRNSPPMTVWQRNYYEHVIRDEKSLYFIRKYIQENPAMWTLVDHENHIDREIRNFELLELEEPFLQNRLLLVSSLNQRQPPTHVMCAGEKGARQILLPQEDNEFCLQASDIAAVNYFRQA